VAAVAVVTGIGFGETGIAFGQNAGPGGMPPDHASHKGHQAVAQGSAPGTDTGKGGNLAAEVARLKEQVSQLQAQVARHGGAPMRMAGPMPRQQMGMAGGRPGMGMMGMMGMGGSGGGMPGMGGATSGGGMMDDDAMMGSMGGGMGAAGGGMMMDNMNMMGMMSGPGAMNMNMTSALPGFPGASHIYHIGATGFFLDHPQHISLTPEQQQKLAELREQAVLAQTEAQRKIDAAEEELWQLTTSDQPSFSKVESKVREIERLRADERLDFVKAVGEAAKVLSGEQRQALLGQAPPMGYPQAGAGMQQQPGMGQGQGMQSMPSASGGMGMSDM
jgi:Spy/CpxP family protein refolding chaperone